MTATGKRLRMFGLAFALLAAGALAAEGMTVFESCVDGRDRAVPVVADYGQRLLVRILVEDGQPEIRYNPDVLPRLSPALRLFFYAGQCARSGLPGSGEPPAARIREADCRGLDGLLDGGLLKPADLPGLAAELAAVSDLEWVQLPGPPRGLPESCPPAGRGTLRLPSADIPAERERVRNDCVRACADRLWMCQRTCRSDACANCLSAYGLCDAACGDVPGAGRRR